VCIHARKQLLYVMVKTHGPRREGFDDFANWDNNILQVQGWKCFLFPHMKQQQYSSSGSTMEQAHSLATKPSAKKES
jgi:hypothetical protein